MCLASQAVVLGTAALVKCHKYFPLFRNGWIWCSGGRGNEGERREKKEATMDESQGRNMEGADGGEVDERSEIND